MLFVGTKEAGAGIREGRGANAPACIYVNARWLGGMLTNFKTIQQQDRPSDSARKRWRRTAPLTLLPKKEVIKLKLEIEKLEKIPGRYQGYEASCLAPCLS